MLVRAAVNLADAATKPNVYARPIRVGAIFPVLILTISTRLRRLGYQLPVYTVYRRILHAKGRVLITTGTLYTRDATL